MVVEDKLEEIKTTKEFKKVLETLGLKEEFERIQKKKVRAGRGKQRGRTYQKRIGPLLIVSKKCLLQKAAKNIPGVDVSVVSNLNIKKLAPGGVSGRLCIFTNSSITALQGGLYMGGKNGPS